MFIKHTGYSSAQNSANCDLYKNIFDLVANRRQVIEVRCMLSHLNDGDARPEGVSWHDVMANDMQTDLQSLNIHLSRVLTCY